MKKKNVPKNIKNMIRLRYTMRDYWLQEYKLHSTSRFTFSFFLSFQNLQLIDSAVLLPQFKCLLSAHISILI